MASTNIQPFEDDNFNDLLSQAPVVPSFVDPYPDIPAELKSLDRWGVYTKVWDATREKYNKPPYNATTLKKGNPIEKSDRSSYAVACAALAANPKFAGLAFGLDYSDGFTVVDFDHCIVAGEIDPRVVEILRAYSSWCEVSVSGDGIHMWTRGWQVPEIDGKQGTKVGNAEMYSGKHYLACTGNALQGLPATIEAHDLSELFERIRAGEFKVAKTDSPSKPSAAQKESESRSSEIEQTGTVITTPLHLLMYGEILETKPEFVVGDRYGNSRTFPSQSEADLSLATLLAFKYGDDAEKINEDFKASPLYRDKWDRKDYSQGTIKKGIDSWKKSEKASTPVTETAAPTVEVIEEEDETIITTDDALPPFPQFTGLLHDLSDAMSPDIPYTYKMASALTYLGIIRSGLDTLADEPHIQPRLYTALIGPPGNGKTAAMNEVGKIMRALTNNHKVYSAIDSGPALVDSFNDLRKMAITDTAAGTTLVESAYRLLLAPDEIKNVFDKSKADSGGKSSMLGEMLKLYEGNETGSRVRGAKIKIELDNAHLGIIGGATEEGYSNMWLGTSGASGGLQSRFTPVGLDKQIMPARQRPADAEKLSVVIPKLVEIAKSPGHRFGVTDAAWALFTRWWSQKDQADISVSRLDGIAKRVAILLAATNGGEVDESLMSQATQFSDYIHVCRTKYNAADSSTLVQAMENLIVSSFEKHGDMTRNVCRRRTNADKKPGGMGPFLQAFKNLMIGEKLAQVRKTGKGEVFRLCS